MRDIVKKKFRKSRKLVISTGMITGLVAAVATAALIGVFLVNMQGTLVLFGDVVDEPISFDGTPLTSETLSVDIDIAELYPGDVISLDHVFMNSGDVDYRVSIDTSNMPLELVDPLSIWYGFQFYIQADGVNVSEILLDAHSSVTLTFWYVLDPAFLDPVEGFPFDLRFSCAPATYGY